jgi:thiamine phosphate synthase YjbQ (UPF0047 family)
MLAHTDYLTMNTRKEREIVRITEDVARAVAASRVQARDRQDHRRIGKE